jgi:hypothetical protein
MQDMAIFAIRETELAALKSEAKKSGFSEVTDYLEYKKEQ